MTNLENNHLILSEILNDYVKEKKFSEFLEILKNKKTFNLDFESNDLVPQLCSYLNPQSRTKLFSFSVDCLNYLSETCTPKHFLLLLLSQISDVQNLTDLLFLTLIHPLFLTYSRIKFPKPQSTSLLLSDLYSRISYLELPEDLKLEKNERKLLQFDKKCQIILKWLKPLQEKISIFVSDNFSELKNHSKNKNELNIFLKFELKILSSPLSFLDISPGNLSTRPVYESIIKTINLLQPNIFKIINDYKKENKTKVKLEKNEEEEEEIKSKMAIDEVGLGVLCYLIFPLQLSDPLLPSVYSHQQILFLLSPFISSLLKDSSSSLHIQKGLDLSTFLFSRLRPDLWDEEVMERSEFIDLIKNFIYISSKSLDEFKKISLQLLATTVKIFKFSSRQKILYFLILKSPHQGVIGSMVGLLRDEIITHNNHSDLHKILDLDKMYKIIFSLPNTEKTDLIQASERIMTALNFLKFLITFDPVTLNKTQIWTLIPIIESKYFKILSQAIDLSKSHYKLEIKKIKEKRSERISRGLEPEVDGEKISDNEKIYFLEMSLNTFEKMSCLLSQMSSMIMIERKKGEKKENNKEENEKIKEKEKNEIGKEVNKEMKEEGKGNEKKNIEKERVINGITKKETEEKIKDKN